MEVSGYQIMILALLLVFYLGGLREMASPMPTSSREVFSVALGVCVVMLSFWFLKAKKRLAPARDPRERQVTEADLKNPENRKTVDLTPLPLASEIVRDCQEGKRSVAQTLEEFLERSRTCANLTNCIMMDAQPIIERRAKAIAEHLDALSPAERMALPLFGLPVSVKECYYIEGTDSTAGLRSLVGKPVSHDAPLITQLMALGAVPFCKTTVPQIMYAWECANPVHGVTSHPLHRSFIPGGSSGGEAALIAGGGSILGLGTDIGGSCRIPAHMSGCVGLKCTRGRISLKDKGPSLTYGDGQQIVASCSGPLARTAEDLAFFLKSVCSAPAIEEMRRKWDNTVVPATWDASKAEVAGKPLTIGWYVDDGFVEASPACARAVREAKAALEKSGARLVEFKPPNVEDAIMTFTNLLCTGLPHIAELLDNEKYVADSLVMGYASTVIPEWPRHLLAALLKQMGSPIMSKAIMALMAKSGAQYYEHVQAAQKYKAEFAAALDPSIDLLLAPVHALPTHAHMTSKDITPSVCYASLYNLLDYPAGVVPVTTVRPDDVWKGPMRDNTLETKMRKIYAQTLAAGTPFPVGVQLVGRPFAEELVIRGMRQLEGQLLEARSGI